MIETCRDFRYERSLHVSADNFRRREAEQKSRLFDVQFKQKPQHSNIFIYVIFHSSALASLSALLYTSQVTFEYNSCRNMHVVNYDPY